MRRKSIFLFKDKKEMKEEIDKVFEKINKDKNLRKLYEILSYL